MFFLTCENLELLKDSIVLQNTKISSHICEDIVVAIKVFFYKLHNI